MSLLLLLQPPAAANPAPQMVASSVTTTSGLTAVVNTTADVLPGQTLVLGTDKGLIATDQPGVASVSVAAGATGSWTLAAAAVRNVTQDVDLLIAACTTLIPSGTAVTVTFNASTNRKSLILASFNDVLSASFETTSGTSEPATGNINTGPNGSGLTATATTSSANTTDDQLAVAVFATGGSGATGGVTPGSTYTQIASVASTTGTNDRGLMMAYKVVRGATGGTQTATASYDVSTGWAAGVATFPATAVAGGGGPASPVTYTDDFNRANGALGANWTTTGATPLTISSNKLNANGAQCLARYVSDASTPAYQFSQVTYQGLGNHGPAVAMPVFTTGTGLSGMGACYIFRQGTANTGGIQIAIKVDSSTTITTLATDTYNCVAGDVMRLEYDGTTLKGSINGVVKITHVPTSPISISSNPCVGTAFTTTTSGAIQDDWSGGTLAVGVSWTAAQTDDTGLEDDLQVFDYGKGIADPLGLTDAPTTVTSHDVQVADTLGLTDAPTTATTHTVAIADNLGLTDTPSAVASFNVSIGDSLGLTDTPTPTRAVAVTVPDSLGLTDTPATAQSYNVTVPDSLGLTDAPTTAVAYSQVLADSEALTDFAVSGVNFTSTAGPDTLGLTDSLQVDQLRIALVTVSDPLNLTDAPTYIANYAPSVADSLGLTDAPVINTAFAQSTVDSLGLTDTSAPVSAFDRQVSDNEPLTDSPASSNVQARTVSDSEGLTDTVSPVTSFSQSIPDSEGLTDTPVVFAFGKGPADTLGLSDSIQVDSVVGLVTFSDNFNRADGVLGSNWALTGTGSATFSISSNAVAVGSSNNGGHYVANGAISSGQTFSQMTYRGGSFIGPAVAMVEFVDGISGVSSAAVGSWYVFRSKGFTLGTEIAQKAAGAGTHTQLATHNQNLVAGDVMRLEYDGAGTLTAYINGVQVMTVAPPSSLTGQYGVGFAYGTTGQAGTVVLDDWSGGSFVPGVAQTVSIASNLGLADAATAVDTPPQNWTATVSDPLGATDAVTTLSGTPRFAAPADSLGLTDSVSVVQQVGWLAAPADSLGLTDVVTPVKTVGPTYVPFVFDTLNLTDIVTPVPILGPASSRTAADRLGLTDSVAVQTNVFSFLDDFNRANGSLGTNWVITSNNPMNIVNNQVVGGSTASMARWATDASPGLIISQMTYMGGSFNGPAVAMPPYAQATTLADAGTWYAFRSNGFTAGMTIVQKDLGTASHTALASISTSLTVGDVMRLEYDGTTLNAYLNGTRVMTVTPTSPILGQYGVGVTHGISNQGGTVILDNWTGGNIPTAPVAWALTLNAPVAATDSIVPAASSPSSWSVSIADTLNVTTNALFEDIVQGFPYSYGDNFDRPDGPLGSDWATTSFSPLTIAGNQVVGGNTSTVARWAIDAAATSSQYSKAEWHGGSYSGVTVAMPPYAQGSSQTQAGTWYGFRTNQITLGTHLVQKIAGQNAYTSLLQVTSNPLSIGDVLVLSYDGAVLTCYINDTQVAAVSPANPIQGQYGVGIVMGSNTQVGLPIIDMWSGGNARDAGIAQTANPADVLGLRDTVVTQVTRPSLQSVFIADNVYITDLNTVVGTTAIRREDLGLSDTVTVSWRPNSLKPVTLDGDPFCITDDNPELVSYTQLASVPTDTLGLTDSISIQRFIQTGVVIRTVSDLMRITDAKAKPGLTVAITENLGITEDLTGAATIFQSTGTTFGGLFLPRVLAVPPPADSTVVQTVPSLAVGIGPGSMNLSDTSAPEVISFSPVASPTSPMNLTDAVSVSQFVAAVTQTRAIADTIGITTPATQAIGRAADGADSLSLTDAVSIVLTPTTGANYTRAVSEIVSVTDVDVFELQGFAYAQTVPADEIDVTDTIDVVQVQPTGIAQTVVVADDLGLLDLSSQAGRTIRAIESMPLTDAVDVVAGPVIDYTRFPGNQQPPTTMHITDIDDPELFFYSQVASIGPGLVSITDTITTSVFLTAQAQVRSVADTLSMVDLSDVAGSAVTGRDNIDLTDNVSVFKYVAGSDIVSVGPGSVGLTDGSAAEQVFFSQVASSASNMNLTDAVSVLKFTPALNQTRTVSDSLNIVDPLSKFGQTFTGNELLALTDGVSTFTFTPGFKSASILDGLSLTDAQAENISFVQSAAPGPDNVNLSDSVTVEVFGGNLGSSSIQDNLTMADAITFEVQRGFEIIDVLGIADTMSLIQNYRMTVSDTEFIMTEGFTATSGKQYQVPISNTTGLRDLAFAVKPLPYTPADQPEADIEDFTIHSADIEGGRDRHASIQGAQAGASAVPETLGATIESV